MAILSSQMGISTAMGIIKTGGTCRINGWFMTRLHPQSACGSSDPACAPSDPACDRVKGRDGP